MENGNKTMKVEDSFSSNPWCVEDATVFLKFCCPECDYQIPDLELFSDHAVGNHDKSTALFGPEKKANEFFIKEEFLETESNENIFVDNGETFGEELFSDPQNELHSEIKVENPLILKDINCKPKKRKAQNEENVVKTKKKKTSKGKGKEVVNKKRTCSICGFECDSSKALKSHKLEHQDGIYKLCIFCEKKFKDWTNLTDHIDRMHPQHFKAQNHVCHVCGFSTLSKMGMQGHMHNKHEVDKHKSCPHCDFRGARISNIHKHIDGHHAELYEKQFDCHHCSRGFVFKTSLNAHLIKHRIRNQLACKYCSAHVSTIQELDNHVLEIHQIDKNTLTGKKVQLKDEDKNVKKEKVFCDLCNVECACPDSLKRHIDKEHTDGKDRLCPHKCDFKTKDWSNLRVHIDSCHPEFGEKKILCDLCGKGFNFKVSCQRHKLQNHQKKFCDICGKECFNKQSLKDHLSSKHAIGEITLMCKYCPFTTNSQGSLKSHTIAKHKVDKHKQCPYCEYHSPMINRIQVHIDSRHPEHDKKNFSCNHCSRCFIYEASLKVHLNNIRDGPKNVSRKKLKRSMNS